MKFISPTYFSNDNRKSKSDPYPHIERIWKDIINTYILLVDEINDVDRQLLISKFTSQIATPRFDFRSLQVSLSKHIKITCFKGFIQFRVEDNSNLELLIPLLECAQIWGVGGKRAMGFGRIKISCKEVDDKIKTENSFKNLKKIEVGSGNVNEF